MAKSPEEKAAEKAAKEQAKAAEKAAKEQAKADAEAAKAAEKATKSGDAISVKYRDHRGETVERTFSKEVHGDSFGALADEFKATNANRLVKD
jgi:membrane protein involved in colicin uptake